MAILRVKDAEGNIHDILAIKGEKGDKGDTGEQGAPGENTVYVGEDEPTGTYNLWIDLDGTSDGQAVSKQEVAAMINEAIGGIENGAY